MKILGLTGRVGSGKNEVAKILHKLGAVILDAHLLGHEILEENAVIKERVAFAFPEAYHPETKKIDRKMLGDIVFAKHEKLLALNTIVHPALKEIILAAIAKYRQSDEVKAVVVNGALVNELGMRQVCDKVWAVDAETTAIMHRLKARGWNTQKALAVLSAQEPSMVYIQQADIVIRNSSDLDSLKHQVQSAYQKFLLGTV